MRLPELTLAMPYATVYRPAPDTPRAREARRRAWHDRDAGISIGDWPQEDRDALMADLKGYAETLRAYHIARHPERISAPASWPAEIAWLAVGTALAACSDGSLTLRALLLSVPLWPLRRWHTTMGAAARRRSVRRLGLTPATAPETRFPPHAWVPLALALLFLRDEWRHRHVRRSTWELWLATQIVRTLNERRSFKAALRRP